MAVWKKVIVSGSTANLAALQVDNLNSGEAVIGGGQGSNLSTRVISGSGAILASGGNNIQLSGSFSGSFFGNGSGLTGVTAQASFALLFGEGIGINAQGSSSYNGNQQVSITVSGAADLTDGRHVKWNNTDNKFANSLIFDDGTNVQITGSNVVVSGSALIVTGSVRSLGGFTGSLLGTAATASFVNNLTQNLLITGSLTLSGSQAIELFVIGGTQFTGSVSSAGGFTGSLLGTASWAANATTATQVGNSITAGSGLTGTTFNGSAASTFDVGAGALITVNADAVMVTTSSLTTNQIPKYSANAFAGSNISDTGTQVQIAAGATSGLSVAAGGITVSAGGVTVTGNSTFNNNLNVIGDITVAGTASFQNTQNLLIGDRFAALASGSTSLTDGGLIIVSSTTAQGMSGSALYLEASSAGTYGRFAVAPNVHVSASAGVTPDEYMVTVKTAQASNPVDATPPTWGSSTAGQGNMWITNAGDIFIYV